MASLSWLARRAAGDAGIRSSTRSIPEPEGLGTLAQASVIVAIFAIALVGLVVMTQRQQAVDRYAEASARAAAAAEEPERSDAGAGSHSASPSPIPAPDAAGPGTYTVQRGDSLFSVASDLGLSPNELIYWNKETYPTLQSTPALTPGWVLATTGPPLQTQPAETPSPQLADVPTFGPDSFPASESVTVGYYDVSGSTPQQISYSMEMNGPYSDWLGLNATAHVEVSASFNFSFEGDPSSNMHDRPDRSGVRHGRLSRRAAGLGCADQPGSEHGRVVDRHDSGDGHS